MPPSDTGLLHSLPHSIELRVPVIRMLYDFGLTSGQKDLFEQVSVMFNFYTQFIPLTFLLGFYIAAIVSSGSGDLCGSTPAGNIIPLRISAVFAKKCRNRTKNDSLILISMESIY